MLTHHKWLMLSAILLLTGMTAYSDTLVYVTTSSGQFGTMNPTTGTFTQIGAATNDPLGGLVPGSSGLLGVSFSGNLDSINPSTGQVSTVGATGLGSSALDTAELAGQVYETDFNNNLYKINTTNGASTLIGATGIPPAPTDPADLIDESLFSYGGKLYVTFDAFNRATNALVTSPELYQIDPITGVASLIGPTGFQIDAAIGLDGSVYAFTAADQVLSLNLTTGGTSLLTSYDSSAFFITGATPTPEPASLALAGIGFGLIAFWKQRRGRLP